MRFPKKKYFLSAASVFLLAGSFFPLDTASAAENTSPDYNLNAPIYDLNVPDLHIGEKYTEIIETANGENMTITVE